MNSIKTLILSLVLTNLTFICKAADDIALSKVVINELKMDYHKVQISQAQELTFSCFVNNIANFNHTGIYINLKIVDANNDTIYDFSTPSKTVLALSIDTIEILTPFNAPLPGSYTLIFKMFQDIQDALPNNNLISKEINVDNYVYQRDNGMMLSTNSWLDTYSHYEIGNAFEVHKIGNITSASAYISSETETGAYMFFTLYEFDTVTHSIIYLNATYEHVIEPSDLDRFVTLFFYPNGYIPLDKQLILVVGSYGGLNFEVGMSQSAEPLTSFYNNFTGWGYLNSTPMVRLHFDEYMNVPIPKTEVWSIHPNPTNSIINIYLPDDNGYPIEVKNIHGQTVYSSTVISSAQISLNHLDSGIYFATIMNQTKKIIKY